MIRAVSTLPTIVCFAHLLGCASTPNSSSSNAGVNERFDASHEAALQTSLGAAAVVASDHLWRDVPAFDSDGRLNVYIEIPRDESTKWEFDLAKNERIVDRTLDPSVGGYPTNYGFVPQSFGYDGDPFDALVLGPPLEGGTTVSGVIVGIMHMDDEKGPDPKVIVSPVGADGKPQFELDDDERKRIGLWFDGYKKPDTAKGKWSKVTGFSDATRAKKTVDAVTEFFRRQRSSS